MKAIDEQVPGIPAEPRLMNCVFAAATAICDEFRKPIVKASAGMGITAWLASDDVGMSSKFMASVLSGQFEAEFAIPYDPADFGRCVRMIKAVPELEQHFDKMLEHGPTWKAVVGNWASWSKMLEDGQHKELHENMRACRQ